MFIKLNLKEAFYNINIAPKDRYKTTFEYNNSKFVCTRLPMGISSAPAIAQRLLKAIIDSSNLQSEHIGYIDDVLVYNDDEQILREDAKRLLSTLTKIK